jgi:hypothetical protein
MTYCSQVHCTHMGERPYAYVACGPILIGNYATGVVNDLHAWKDLMTLKTPCRGLSIRLAQG